MASLIKRIRQRWGISAPRMTIRTHVAWYWRWLGLVVAGAFSYALAIWIYDAGRQFAGFDRSEIEQEMKQLRESVARLEDERGKLRAIADAADSRLKIEQTAQARLVAQAKALEDENVRLKEDLAFFENLVPASGDRLVINRFRVEPDALPGEYRYRLLLVQTGRRDVFQGSMQLVAEVVADGRSAMITFPDTASAPGAAGVPPYKLAFKYFHRVEGTFRVPAGAKVKAVQVRIFDSGSTQARVTQGVTLN